MKYCKGASTNWSRHYLHCATVLLKKIFFKGTPTVPGVLSWQELLDIGRGLPDSVLQVRNRDIYFKNYTRVSETSGFYLCAQFCTFPHYSAQRDSDWKPYFILKN